MVYFDFKDNRADNIKTVVYNLLGQEVKSQFISGSQGRISIPVTDFQPGIYFCSFFVNEEMVATEKFIVKK